MNLIRNITLVGLSFFLMHCQMAPDNSKNESVLIVCTTGMLADMVMNIVGKQAKVVALMGPGVDPHLYKATQGDLQQLNRADIIVYNGLHLEGKMGEIFEKLEDRKIILKAAEGLRNSDLINTTAFQGAYDPHIWFDVSLWNKAGDYLAEKLIEDGGFEAKEIVKNNRNYSKQLDSLHQWVKLKIQELDSARRVLITAHDAFGYFGRAYGIQVKGLQGISTVSEYGLKDVSDLVNFISKRKIKAVFVESSVSDRSLKAVVEGCRSRGHEIKIGGTLYSDAMGESGTKEGNYIGMVKYNVNTIVEQLK